MKVEEVPQDLKYFNRGLVRDQNYALDSEGKYQKVWSDGWEPKNDALDVALEDDKDNEERSRMELYEPEEFHGFELNLEHRSASHCENGVISMICILAMNRQFLPPNLNWETPMEGGIIPVTGSHSSVELRHVMSNAFGFGGNDSSIILSRYEG